MDIVKFHGFIAIALLSTLVSASLPAAVPEDFIGSWHVTAYGDSDFSDGVTLRSYDLSVSVSLSTDPERDLDISILDTVSGGTLNTSMDVDPYGVARITNNDVPWPGIWPEFPVRLGDAVVMTEGNGMAVGVVGREPTDRDSTGVFYSLWQKSPITTVTAEDFLGAWDANQSVSNPNLRNPGSLSWSLFSTGTFTAGSNPDTIMYDMGLVGVEPLELQVSGSRAFLTAPVEGSGLLAFDLLHDGENILFAMVGQEYDDLTDVSLGLGSASPVPLPATAWFMMSGIGLIGILRHRFRPWF
jgi:hypothetical protein